MDDIGRFLINAVSEGDLQAVRELVGTYGLSYSKSWSKGYVPFREAVMYNHTEIAKFLYRSGAKLSSKSSMRKPNHTPLHFACLNNNLEIVCMILDRDCNVNARNECGITSFHYASINGNIDIIELLLSHGADINITDNEGLSALHFAVKGEHLEIVEFLLDNGALINCTSTSKWDKNYTPLHFAVEKGCNEITRLLLSRYANVDIKIEDDMTPLHIASRKGYGSIVDDLLSYGANIHSITLKEEYTPLHFASELNNKEIVKLFLDRGANVNAKTKSYLTPLHLATKRGHKKIVKILLQCGANVDSKDKFDNTVLFLAIRYKHFTLVDDILRYCPDVNSESNKRALTTAVINLGTEFENIIVTLLEYGFTVNVEDLYVPGLLLFAIRKGYIRIVEDFLKNGADINIISSIKYVGFPPLHEAIRYNREEIAKLMINYGAELDALDDKSRTPLYLAVEKGFVNITKLLLSSGANIKDDPTLLFLAVKLDLLEIVRVLLEYDVDVNASDALGRVALNFIVFNENEYFNEDYLNINYNLISAIKGDIAYLLLSNGANVNARTAKGTTTLHVAAREGYVRVVQALLEYEANINCKDKKGNTPLHLSAHRGNEFITRILLGNGADANARQNDGLTPLVIATKKGHKGIVRKLLRFGANADYRFNSNKTPLHLSAEEGYEEITEILLEYDANINAKDDFGETAMHIASLSGHEEVAIILLHSGTDINIKNIINRTPFYCALEGASRVYNIRGDGDFRFDPERGICLCEEIADLLQNHMIKMQIANLYLNERNLQALIRDEEEEIPSWRDAELQFRNNCEEEIARMRGELIPSTNITFFDIMGMSTNLLATYMRNANLVQILNSGEYKIHFPIYKHLIEIYFQRGIKRRDLLERCDIDFNFVFRAFPYLPYDCVINIFDYLNNEDLRIFIEVCDPFNYRT